MKSFGCSMILNSGAGSESPIWYAWISMRKKLMF